MPWKNSSIGHSLWRLACLSLSLFFVTLGVAILKAMDEPGDQSPPKPPGCVRIATATYDSVFVRSE